MSVIAEREGPKPNNELETARKMYALAMQQKTTRLHEKKTYIYHLQA